jgi:hypothetical protein
LFAVSLNGKERQVERVAGDLVLYDIARDERVLIGHEDWRGVIYALGPGQDRERDLSWFDFSIATDLSRDGRMVLFNELGEMGGALSPAFLRGTDGSPAVRLSEGLCGAFSHDMLRVICANAEGQLVEVPTRVGEPRLLTHDSISHTTVAWLADDKGREVGRRSDGD